MSLRVQCKQCGKAFRVEDSWAGKRVRCKTCSAIMVIPIPDPATADVGAGIAPTPENTAAPELQWDAMAALESAAQVAAAPAVFDAYSMPPAYHEYADAPSPYITIPGEEHIDRWVPWGAVALFALNLLIVFIASVSGLMKSGSGTNPNAMAVGVAIGLIIGLGVAICAIAASSGLMVLGVYIGSQIMKFPNHRLLYWRCVAAVCTSAAISSLLHTIGLDISIIRWFLAISCGLGVLWVLLRLRLAPFAVAGGIGATLGLLLPLGCLFGSQTALASLARKGSALTPAMVTPAGSAPAGPGSNPLSALGASIFDPRIALRQQSAAKLKMIHSALWLYANDHGNRSPQTLAELVDTEHLPAENLTPPSSAVSYSFRGFDNSATNNPIIVYEQGDRSVMGGVNVLYLDGTVQFFQGNMADLVLNMPVMPPMASRFPSPGGMPFTPGQPYQPSQVQQPNFPSPTFQPPTFQPPTFHPPNFQPPTHQRPSFPNLQLPENPADPQPAPGDPTETLNKIARGYKTYFSSHNSTYPHTLQELARSGALPPETNSQPTGWHLFTTPNLPPLSDLPPDLIIVYVTPTTRDKYYVLFGDWHVAEVDAKDFGEIRMKSSRARRTASQR